MAPPSYGPLCLLLSSRLPFVSCMETVSLFTLLHILYNRLDMRPKRRPVSLRYEVTHTSLDLHSITGFLCISSKGVTQVVLSQNLTTISCEGCDTYLAVGFLCGAVVGYPSDDLHDLRRWPTTFSTHEIKTVQVTVFQKVVYIWLLTSSKLSMRAGNRASHVSCSCCSLTVMNRRSVNSCDDDCKIERKDMIIS